MNTRMLVIPVSGIVDYRDVTMPARDNIAAYHKALKELVEPVTGYPMEHVNVFYRFDPGSEEEYRDMFVNENGHLTGMEVNEMATFVYWNNVIAHGQETVESMFNQGATIVGPAVLFRDKVWI